ncbi:unnamed protein product, partial [Mesorhabditis belari]|uniref:Uncharacterized protein n=1 Tax=Mesorhabditis belari TaxID=2138241 RepID=A0AAF3ETS8_9BILA
MGNSQYSQLQTADPSELISPRLLKSASAYNCRQPKRKPSPHIDNISALAAVRPGMLISGSKDKVISLNNLDVGESIMRWRGHEKEVTKVAYRNTGGRHLVLSASRDETIRLWQFNTAESQKLYKGHRLPVTGLVIFDQDRFASGSRDTSIRIWDLETGKVLMQNDTNRNLVTHMAYNSMNNWIAQSSEDKYLRIWDTRSLEAVQTYPRKMHIQTYCEFTPDANFVMSTSNGFNGDGCTITIWDTRMQRMFKELSGHDSTVTGVANLHQSVTQKKLIVSVSLDQTARVWSLDDGVSLWTESIPSGCGLLACASFSDASLAISGCDGLLAHLRLLGRGGRPLLHCTSYHTIQTNSTSNSAEH